MRTDCWLTLSLFGIAVLHRVQVSSPGQPVPLCSQSRNLLAYLALSRGSTCSRDELSRAMREDNAEPARPGSVNSALWRLRKTLECQPFTAGRLICTQRDGQVGLRADAPLRVDVETYLQHVLPALSQPIDAVDSAAVERLRLGVALYTGDLLSGVHDDWVLREREKLRRHQINALGRLVQLSVREGDIAGGIGHALAILDIDELREEVHRDLMRLYLLVGQRALALRQYERCRQALRRELSILPMPETQALCQQIADGGIAFNSTAAASGAETPDSELTLAELLTAARRHLAAADAQLLRATQPSR